MTKLDHVDSISAKARDIRTTVTESIGFCLVYFKMRLVVLYLSFFRKTVFLFEEWLNFDYLTFQQFQHFNN